MVVFEVSSPPWVGFGLQVLFIFFEEHSYQEMAVEAAQLEIVLSVGLSSIEMENMFAQAAFCDVLFATFEDRGEAFFCNEETICDYLVAEVSVLAISRRK